MKERAKRFLTSIVAALTLVGSVPTQVSASELDSDSSLISPQDTGSTPDAGNAPAVESSTPASGGTTGDNTTTTNATVTDTTATNTTTTGTTTDTTVISTTTETTTTDTTTTDTTTTDTTTTDTTTTNTTTTDTTTTDTTTTDTTTDDSADIEDDDLDDLDLEDMADALVLSFEASTFSLRTAATQEPTLLAEEGSSTEEDSSTEENQATTPVINIGELGNTPTDAGWSAGSETEKASGWRYDGTSVSMVNNGTAVDVHADGTGVNFNMAGVNRIGTLYADDDVNITGTGILLIDKIDMLEGKNLNLLTNTDRYDKGTGSVAVFLRNAETGKYELINGNVKGILDEEYTIPDGIELVVPDGGTLDMRITTQVTTTTDGNSETHYGLTNTDYGLLDNNPDASNSYIEEVQEGENMVSRVLGITVPKLTISSKASLLLKGNAKLLLEAFEETVLTHAHHSSTLVVNGELTLADNAALELTNHASDINTHTSSSQFSVVMNAGGSVTGSGTLSGAAVTYNGGSGTIHFTGDNSFVDVQCTQNPDMTFTTTGNTDVFYSDDTTLKALDAKDGGSFSLYAKATKNEATTSIDGFASRLNITDSVDGTCNVKSGYVSLNGNLMNERFTVNASDYGAGKLQIISLTRRNTYIERDKHNGFAYFSSGATNTYNNSDWTQLEMYGSDLSQTNPYTYSILNGYVTSLDTESETFVCATDTQLFEIYMHDPNTNVTTVSLILKNPGSEQPICVGEAVDPSKVFLVRCVAGTVTAEAPFTGSIVNPGTSNTGSGILGGSNAGSFNGGGASSVLGGTREPSGGDNTDNGNTDNGNTDNGNTDNGNTDNGNTGSVADSSDAQRNPSVDINDAITPTTSAESVRDVVVKAVSDIENSYQLAILLDGVEQKTLAGGTIPVAMEVSLEEGWNRNDLFVVFRGENGKLVAVKARYNPATGMLMFDAPMLGKFQLVSFHWDGTDYESEAFLSALDDYMS